MTTDSATSFNFFEDTANPIKFEFIKPQSRHQTDLDTIPTIINTFTCKNMVNGATLHGFFALQNNYIVFYGNTVDDNKPEFLLDVSYAKIRWYNTNQPQDRYTCVLTKAGDSYELEFSERATLEEWIEIFRSLCIATNFHEEYLAVKIIGRGGFAKVYMVEAKSTKKKYAVKAFTKESLGTNSKTNPKLVMMNEIDLLRELKHDNIIKLHEVHESENSIYLVMELIEGKPLQSVLKSANFKKEYSDIKIRQMIYSILDALAYLASKGIMHRDLKPDNILVDKNGTIKIVDFGLATHINVSEYIFRKCGTPGYMAPEVFRYDAKKPTTFYDDRCDVFSAGCILYFMTYGYPLFKAKGVTETILQNKEFTGYQGINLLKKGHDNQINLPNLEVIPLLTQMLEIDKTKRITAAQALGQPYFTSVTSSPIRKLASMKKASDQAFRRHSLDSNVIIQLNLREKEEKLDEALAELSDLISVKSSMDSPKSGQQRFTQRDSLFLDVGKTEMNGKITTLNQASGTSLNGSVQMKCDKLNRQLSQSSFKSGSLSEQKARGQSRSFRVSNLGHGAGNQNFLKAAIFNNMNRNNETHGEERRRGSDFGLYVERRNTDTVLPLPSDPDSTPSVGSEDFDGIDEGGNEDCKIQLNNNKTMNVHSPGRHLAKFNNVAM